MTKKSDLLSNTNLVTWCSLKQPILKLNNRQKSLMIKDTVCLRSSKRKDLHQIHPVFHKCLLHPYHQGDFPSQKKAPPPPPEIISGVEEAEVEYIIDSKCVGNTIHYLIHWKGFPHEENEWIPVKELTNTQTVIRDFHHSNPDAP